MVNQDKLSEQQIAELMKKIGPLKEPPADMEKRVKASVREAWVEQTTPMQTPRASLIAATIAALSIGFVFTLQRPEEILNVATVDVGQRAIEVLSENQQWASLSGAGLPEGTIIRVNGNTPISFTFSDGMNVRATPGTRLLLASSHEITLKKGSIYLDSYDREQPKPFTVTTSFGSARDVGTQFMVSLSDADAWSVQVREGEVSVADDDHTISLGSGDAITISAENDVSEKHVSTHDTSWRWSETARPGYNIENQYLNDYLLWVSRETGRELRFRSATARQSATRTRLHGTIDGLSASDSLKQVLETTELRLVAAPEKVIMVDVLH